MFQNVKDFLAKVTGGKHWMWVAVALAVGGLIAYMMWSRRRQQPSVAYPQTDNLQPYTQQQQQQWIPAGAPMAPIGAPFEGYSEGDDGENYSEEEDSGEGYSEEDEDDGEGYSDDDASEGYSNDEVEGFGEGDDEQE